MAYPEGHHSGPPLDYAPQVLQSYSPSVAPTAYAFPTPVIPNIVHRGSPGVSPRVGFGAVAFGQAPFAWSEFGTRNADGMQAPVSHSPLGSPAIPFTAGYPQHFDDSSWRNQANHLVPDGNQSAYAAAAWGSPAPPRMPSDVVTQRGDSEVSKLIPVSEEGFNLKDMARGSLEKKSSSDVKEAMAIIRDFVAKAEETINRIGKLVMMDPHSPKSHVVSCPFDSRHRVPSEALFRHFIRCPAGLRPEQEVNTLMSSLKYSLTAKVAKSVGNLPDNMDPDMKIKQSTVICKLDDPRQENLKATIAFGSSDVLNSTAKEQSCKDVGITEREIREFDLWGGPFFYCNAPAVVQADPQSQYSASPLTRNLRSLKSSGNTAADAELGMRSWCTPDLDQVFCSEEREMVGESSRPKETPQKLPIGFSESKCEYQARTHAQEDLKPLLPSRFWFLLKEVETWRDYPAECSCIVLEAAAAVRRIRKSVIVDWLLLNSPDFGIVLNLAMGYHICSLVAVCLKAVQIEATLLLDQDSTFNVESFSRVRSQIDDNQISESDCAPGSSNQNVRKERSPKIFFVDCPVFSRSANWLASRLSLLYESARMKDLILGLLKHSIISSGQLLAAQLLPFGVKKFGKQGLSEVEVKVGQAVEEDNTGAKHNWQTVQSSDLKLIEAGQDTVQGSQISGEVSLEEEFHSSCETFLEEVSSNQLEAALAAVEERALLENNLKYLALSIKPKRFQMIQEHEIVVKLGAEERSRRPNIRAVLEHDGLIWHRSQLMEKNKNKTREEMLAEERDYKRRRMSYRGKKIKRTPTQVLHDIIKGHMEEIEATGGIGGFGRDSVNDPTVVGTPESKDLMRSTSFIGRNNFHYQQQDGEQTLMDAGKIGQHHSIREESWEDKALAKPIVSFSGNETDQSSKSGIVENKHTVSEGSRHSRYELHKRQDSRNEYSSRSESLYQGRSAMPKYQHNSYDSHERIRHERHDNRDHSKNSSSSNNTWTHDRYESDYDQGFSSGYNNRFKSGHGKDRSSSSYERSTNDYRRDHRLHKSSDGLESKDGFDRYNPSGEQTGRSTS